MHSQTCENQLDTDSNSSIHINIETKEEYFSTPRFQLSQNAAKAKIKILLTVFAFALNS